MLLRIEPVVHVSNHLCSHLLPSERAHDLRAAHLKHQLFKRSYFSFAEVELTSVFVDLLFQIKTLSATILNLLILRIVTVKTEVHVPVQFLLSVRVALVEEELVFLNDLPPLLLDK